jgi:septal ring factor EnvC (AmiA/AmiB activator)
LAVAAKFLDSRRARIALLGGIVAVIVIAGTVSAVLARSALEDSRDELSAAETERQETRHKVRKTERKLEATNYGRLLIRAQLEETERQIRRSRGNLGTTRERAASKYARIPVLTECLNGVSSALNAAAVGDNQNAVLAVVGVNDICARARGQE